MRAIFLSLGLSLVTGCQLIGARTCTMMYAPSGVTIELASDSWAPGEYEVQVNGELCLVTLPGGEDLDCSVPLQLTLDADGTGLQALTLTEEVPGVVDIVLIRDGEELDAVSVYPTYEEWEPNGKGCGVTAWAEERVEVDAS